MLVLNIIGKHVWRVHCAIILDFSDLEGEGHSDFES